MERFDNGSFLKRSVLGLTYYQFQVPLVSSFSAVLCGQVKMLSNMSTRTFKIERVCLGPKIAEF